MNRKSCLKFGALDLLKYYFHALAILFLIEEVLTQICPSSETIVPCRCSIKGKEVQIWCSHSNLPQIMDAIKAVERNIRSPIDELVLENNQLPSLPGRFFGTLQIVRLMLRHNGIERVSHGWLNELQNSLIEIYLVEPQLRSLPTESLSGMINMVAITIQSNDLKHLPDFSGLLSLTYLSVQSKSLTDLQPQLFMHLPKLQNLFLNGGKHLNRLEEQTFKGLISVKNIDLSRNGINWIHLRSLNHLPSLSHLKLSYNQISDASMIGRIIKDLENLKRLRLDHNIISLIKEGSFVDLPHILELHLNDNLITEIQYGAFLRTPMLKTIYLHNNYIQRIHPESFLQASGSGVETLYMYNNRIEVVSELRSILEALPALKFLDISNNYLMEIPFGALRGHGTLEQLYINNNLLHNIGPDALMAMPGLRELRLRNNSLSHELHMPFWNLPGLKGLDLSLNNFHNVNSFLLSGLPLLRRLDLSENGLSNLDPSSFVHNAMLETLNISFNNLFVVHPRTFQHLDRLFEVDASHNKLSEIIPGLSKFIERVSLRHNHITQIPTLSSHLNLPNLRMLDLSHNYLEYLPNYGFQDTPQVRVLSLANNRLRTLNEDALVGANRLELLHLQDNSITHIHDRTFLPLSNLRNLNLQGNKLESITDVLFSNNTRLEHLDLSRNSIQTISTSAFENQQMLEYLDLADNSLTDIPNSLISLINIKDIDLSYNKITRINVNVISAWHDVVEIRLSNNYITGLKRGSFRNLPNLQYLDLSSNEITYVESGSISQLIGLQELVLADNKLIELKDRVFENLPNLLASHLQYNNLRYMPPYSFYNSSSLIYLNLSNNHFANMDSIGLQNMRSLEVLDLSANKIKLVEPMPLRALSWLVELNMDNNQICKIKGLPFDTMPRLRVLTMRNNNLHKVKERIFHNLRTNLAILDMEGNPIVCSCDMQWLSVWLQETNFPYPGPKCQDGRLLRASRIDKKICDNLENISQRTNTNINGNGSLYGYDSLPLLNEHGDIFQRKLKEEISDECEILNLTHEEQLLAGESGYFYDQNVEHSAKNQSANLPILTPINGSSSLLSTSYSPTMTKNLNNTILNTNYINKHPVSSDPNQSSLFTFFGYPVPSLSFGRYFSNMRSDTEPQGRNLFRQKSTQSRGKVRMYQPNSAEFDNYLQGKQQNLTSRNRIVESGSEETVTNPNIFKTAFRNPISIEKGGFRPILPNHERGFQPVHDPHIGRGKIEIINKSASKKVDPDLHNKIKVETISTSKKAVNSNGNITNVTSQTIKRDSDQSLPTLLLNNQSKEKFKKVPPETPNKLNDGENYDGISAIKVSITTQPTTATSNIISLSTSANFIITSSTMSYRDETEITSTNNRNNEEPLPIHGQNLTETILLIPPPEEHVEQFKRYSWVTPTNNDNSIHEIDNVQSTTEMAVIENKNFAQSGGRSIITKMHQLLPTAEEYYRLIPEHDLTSYQKPTAHSQKQSDEIDHPNERIDKKNGIDWYYEEYAKSIDNNHEHDQDNLNWSSKANIILTNFSCIFITTALIKILI